MDPAHPSNLDVVASDTVTPSANSKFNLGHDSHRWLFSYFQRVWLSEEEPYYDDETVT
jgi:hypothetical protein